MTPVAVEQPHPGIRIALPAPTRTPAALYPCRERDWIAATLFLSAMERNALWRLLSFMWQRGTPLPRRPAELAAIAGVPLRHWDAVAVNLAQLVERDEHGRCTCPELLARRARLVARRQTARNGSEAAATA